MKYILSIFLYGTILLLFSKATAQNVSINILSHNTGFLKKDGDIIIEVTINNTDPSDSVPPYKLRPQISIPASIVSVATEGHSLPAGWAIVTNDKGVVRLTNGTDKLPPNSARTILLKLHGIAAGGPSSVSGNLLFSNGLPPGSISGTATTNDNPADNTSSTTCEVTN